MIDERHAIALRFRTLSSRFQSPHGIGLYEEAGRVVVAAYERGYLDLPQLAPFIERVQNQPSRAEAEKAGLLPAESYLFLELAGYNTWPCMLHADGLPDSEPFEEGEEGPRPVRLPDDAEVKVRSIEIIGDAIGGIMPSIMNNSPILPRPRAEQDKGSQLGNIAELHALVCRCLADKVEQSFQGGKERGPESGEETPPEPAVSASTGKGKIVVEGEGYDAPPHWCTILEELAAQDGGYMTYAQFNLQPGCGGKNWHRELKKLRNTIPAIKQYLVTDPGKGTRLLSEKA